MDSQDSRDGYGPLVLRLVIAVMFVSVGYMVVTSPEFTTAPVATATDTMPTKLVDTTGFHTKDAVALTVVIEVSNNSSHNHREEAVYVTRRTVMEVGAKYFYADIRDGNQKFENEVRTRLGDRLWRTGGKVDSIWVHKIPTATR